MEKGTASMWNAMAESCDVAQLAELQSRLQEARESRTSLKMQMEGEAGADVDIYSYIIYTEGYIYVYI